MVIEESCLIEIQVMHAAADHVWRRDLQLPRGATVAQALEASGLYQAFPPLASAAPAVGIFGRRCSLNEVLHAGDRVEVYRPLVFDPMESRRRRIRHRQRRASTAAS